MRTALTRPEVRRLLDARPFAPFALTMENGDRIIIEHPENIAFDPTGDGPGEFYVITKRIRIFSTFEAVTGVALADDGGSAA